MKNKFVIVDPCNLKEQEKWWSEYGEILFSGETKGDKDKQLISFGGFQAIVVLNPEGDISYGEYLLVIPNNAPINIPGCDSGNHLIFNFEDVKNDLPSYKDCVIFESDLELKELENNFIVISDEELFKEGNEFF